jgi:hypothetical protein
LRRGVAAVALVAGLVVPPAELRAYEPIETTAGGGLHGVVRCAGAAPAPARIPIDRDAAVCGRHADDVSLVVGPGGGLAHAAVWLVDVAAGRGVDVAHSQPLDNVHCQFEPHVQTLSVGQALRIRNSDPILHNTHAHVVEGEGNVFNIALPTRDKEVRKVMKKPGIHQVKCDAGHTWMSAWFLVFEHPYHTVTDAQGRFALRDVPPGTYTLRVWHEKLGTQDVRVEIAAGKDIELAPVALRPAP